MLAGSHIGSSQPRNGRCIKMGTPVKACTQVLVELLVVLVFGGQRPVHNKLAVLIAALPAHCAHINHHDLHKKQ